jgi:hypothetical protein
LGERRLVSVRVAERAAATLIERFSVSAIPVEVEDIALRLGATIVRKPLERTISGLLLREGGAKLIAVNTDHHPRRQRFTIAHEVGHLQLHAGDYIVDSTMRVNRAGDRGERIRCCPADAAGAGEKCLRANAR